jgi:hypothetical protein
MEASMTVRAATAAAALGLVLLGAPAASASTSAAVGGVRNPAADVLELTVLAREDDGVGLRSAEATLGGLTLDSEFFGDPACLPGTPDAEAGCPNVGTVTLTVATTAVPDGVHRLQVTVVPGSGDPVVVYDETITVANAPPVSTSSVTVTVGSGAISPGPPSGGGGPPPPAGDDRGCASPRLSMFLAQTPLGFRRGVPVLAAGRRYRYQGRLTCRVDGRRRSAPRGTRVEVRNRLRGRTFVKPALKVRDQGLILARLAYPSSRVVVFRVRATGGELVSVRIPIRVVRLKRKRS